MKNKLLHLVILIVLIFPTFRFFLTDKMYTFSDETQIANFHQYFKAIDLGQFPPRWAPDMNYEFGSPFLSYNYQLPYYLGYLGHLGGLPITTIFKLLMALTVVVGSVGMFYLANLFASSTLLALFAGILYAYTPYQAIDRFIRGAIGEAFALAILPWLFASFYQIYRKPAVASTVYSGVLFGLLVISHQPAALFTLPLLLVIFCLSSILDKRPKDCLYFLKAVLVGLFLSAYYWIPVMLEKKHIVASSPFNYLDQFPFIWQLIYSKWTYHGANPFSPDTFSFQIGLVNIFILALGLLFILLNRKKKAKDNQNRHLLLSLILVTITVIFMMNIRSNFVWKIFPLLQVIQFPWRLLMFTTLFTPIIFLLVYKYISPKYSRPLIIAMTAFVIVFNFSYFSPGKIVDKDDSYYLNRFLPRTALYQGEEISKEYFNHAEDYVPLPVSAIREKILPKNKLVASQLDTQISVISDNPYRYQVQAIVNTDDDFTFNTFYYPGWTVLIDKKKTVINPNDRGVITFFVPSGRRQIDIVYLDTPIRRFSNIISLVSISITLLYLLKFKPNKRVTPTA